MNEIKSIAFEAGKAARLRGEKLKNSALKNIRIGCQQYEDFIAGFDSVKKKPKMPNVRGAVTTEKGSKHV